MTLIHWGDFPTWVAATGTTGAFVTGGGLLIRELRRDHIKQDKEKRSQADQIVAWQRSTIVSNNVVFSVVNNSDLPIYHVVIIYEDLKGKAANFDMGMVAGRGALKQMQT